MQAMIAAGRDGMHEQEMIARVLRQGGFRCCALRRGKDNLPLPFASSGLRVMKKKMREKNKSWGRTVGDFGGDLVLVNHGGRRVR
jgi:hypothetical protein